MSTSRSKSTSGTNLRNTRSLELKELKSPKETGTKKEFEDFIEIVDNHVTINWILDKIHHMCWKNNELPIYEEPKDSTDEEEEVKWKVHLWNKKVD